MFEFPPHILVVLDKPLQGGAEKALLSQLKHHKSQGGSIYLITEKGGDLQNEFTSLAHSTLFVKFPYVSKIISWIHYIPFLFKASAFIKKLPSDTTIFVNDLYPLWAITQLKRHTSINLPIWSLFQGEYVFDDDSCPRKWIRYGAPYANRLLGSTPLCAHANSLNILPKPVEPLNPPIDTQRFLNPNPQNLANTLNLDPNKKTAIIAGRVCTPKGQRWLTEEFLKNTTLTQNWQLIIAGPILDDIDFWQNIQSQHPKSIKLLGHRDDIENLFAISNLALFPGTINESFGLALAEALLANLPIIAFNQGAFRFQLSPNHPSLVSTPNQFIQKWLDF